MSQIENDDSSLDGANLPPGLYLAEGTQEQSRQTADADGDQHNVFVQYSLDGSDGVFYSKDGCGFLLDGDGGSDDDEGRASPSGVVDTPPPADEAPTSGVYSPPLAAAATASAAAGTSVAEELRSLAHDGGVAQDVSAAEAHLASSSAQPPAGFLIYNAVATTKPCGDSSLVDDTGATLQSLLRLESSLPKPASEVTLLLTSRDVFAPKLRYIFGITRSGFGCIVSTFR